MRGLNFDRKLPDVLVALAYDAPHSRSTLKRSLGKPSVEADCAQVQLHSSVHGLSVARAQHVRGMQLLHDAHFRRKPAQKCSTSLSAASCYSERVCAVGHVRRRRLSLCLKTTAPETGAAPARDIQSQKLERSETMRLGVLHAETKTVIPAG